MFRYVDFSTITGEHIEHIARSLLAAPEAVRPDASQMIKDLAEKRSRLFEWDDGLVIVGQRDKRLTLDAFCCNNGISMEMLRILTADLQRLAADWECDTIETICFDPHITSVIKHLGGRVESTTMTLAVEPSNG